MTGLRRSAWRRVWPAATSVALALAFGCGTRHAPPPQSPGTSPVQIAASPGVELAAACTPTGPELCFNAADDNCNGIIDEGCGVETGLVQFVVAWDQPTADVDLLVTDPNGELVEAGRVAKSGLTKQRDCPGRHSDCHGQNYENAYLAEGDPVRGKYQVRIRLEKLGNESPPIKVRLGARVGPKTYSAEVELTKPEDEREVIFTL